MWRLLLHRFKHWLQWTPCLNHVERRDGVLWHVVTCVECEEVVLEFPEEGL